MTSLALAALPLACVLVGMVGLRLSAVWAGLAGLAVALVIALLPGGGYGLATSTALALPTALGGTIAEALSSAATILWIILPALALYAYQSQTGALDRLRDTLTGLTANRRQQALLIAWFFGLFMEGAAGFGTPVALAAPLLFGMGYNAVRAVALALLGHAAGVSFGAVGTPTLAQIELSGLDPQALAGTVAAMHALVGWLLLLAMVRLADETRLSGTDLRWTVLAGLCFFMPSVALASLAGPELPSLAGAMLGALAFIIVLRRGRPPLALDAATLLRDLAPYLAIVVLILLTRLVPAIHDPLSGWTWSWQLHGRFTGAFAPAYHPGTMLWLGMAVAAFTTGRARALPDAALDALRRLLAVGLALSIMLILSRLMVHAGMIDALARSAAATGPAWPLLAPSVGVLGTFITGSATTSNILFTELQLDTRKNLSLSRLA